MPYLQLPLRCLTCLTMMVLSFAFATSAQAENLRVLEVEYEGVPVSRAAELQETQDGLDPVTHQMLFDAPTDPRSAQILWYSQSDPIVFDPGEPEDFGQYPMVLYATLPQNGDLMYQAWSIDDQRMVDGFTHIVTGPDWELDDRDLASLPQGDYMLLASIRIGGKPRAQASQRIAIRSGEWSRPTNPGTGADGGDPGEGMIAVDQLDQPADGRIIYVSSSTGNDANDGLTPQTALRTPSRGVAKLRDNNPDWLLFRRGDTFEGGLGRWEKSGRALNEPMVVGSYGDAADARPLFKTDGEGLLNASGGRDISFVIFSDLHGYANRRDPDSRDFKGGRDIEVGVWWMRAGGHIRFENLLLEYYSNAMNAGQRRQYDIHDISLHRCVFRKSYVPWDMGHSQGFFADRITGLTVTDCVFDHNGWNNDVRRAHRTGFNHNIYLYQCAEVLIEGCVMARGSNTGLKIRSDEVGITHDLTVRNNLFVGNLTGIKIGSDPNGEQDRTVHENVSFTGNVFTHNGGPLPSGTVLGNAIVVEQTNRMTIADNLFIDKTADTNWYAININTWLPTGNVSIQRNITHRWSADEPLINGAGTKERGVSLLSNSVNLSDTLFQDGSRSLLQYLQTQTPFDSIESYCDSVANPVGVDMAGPQGAQAIVEYLQQGFSR